MKAKHQRMIIIAIAFVSLASAVALALTQFNDNIVYFYSPTELKTKTLSPNQVIRIGGLVKEGMTVRLTYNKTSFVITDLNEDVQVTYVGMIPNLFREGQGMIAKGKLESGVFVAEELLAKHDEKYMPREVVDSLKASGKWKEGQKEPTQ